MVMASFFLKQFSLGKPTIPKEKSPQYFNIPLHLLSEMESIGVCDSNTVNQVVINYIDYRRYRKQ